MSLISAPPAAQRMIPVGGGKGGVGKSFVVANLSVVLARSGKRVIAAVNVVFPWST